MNKKVLWKIEELWKKYFHHNMSLGGRKTARLSAGNSQVLFERFYKNNISVYNPNFHFVKEFNFEPSEKIVHSDDYGEYLGLKHSQVLGKDRKLIYLFDNHNKIIQVFLEYYEVTKQSFDVVHIDAHNDDAVFAGQKPHNISLKNVQTYIKQTRISDFFDFLSEATIPCYSELDSESKSTNKKLLINKIHRYTKSTDFKNFKKPKNSYILSLDIDILGPEGDFIDLESKIKIIAEAWQYADVVCISMSPGFINQDFAKEIVDIFIKDNI